MFPSGVFIGRWFLGSYFVLARAIPVRRLAFAIGTSRRRLTNIIKIFWIQVSWEPSIATPIAAVNGHAINPVYWHGHSK